MIISAVERMFKHGAYGRMLAASRRKANTLLVLPSSSALPALIICPPHHLSFPAASEALRVIKEAKALEAAGCFSVVLECVPGLVAAAVTRELGIPTIGIGAGPATSGQVGPAGDGWFGKGEGKWTGLARSGCPQALLGQHMPPSPPYPSFRLWPPLLQVLVYHDLLGMMQHPHHAKVTPKFCKQYSAVGAVIQEVGQQLCCDTLLHCRCWCPVLSLLASWPQLCCCSAGPVGLPHRCGERPIPLPGLLALQDSPR